MGCTNRKSARGRRRPTPLCKTLCPTATASGPRTGSKRASREATPLKAAADPFQTVDLTNPETAAAASDARAPARKAPDPDAAWRAPTAPVARPRRRLRRAQGADSRRSGRHVGCATRLGRQRPGGHDQQSPAGRGRSRRRRSRSRRRPRPGCARRGADAGAADDAPAARDGLDSGRRRADPRDDGHGPARGRDDQERGRLLARRGRRRAAHEPRRRDSRGLYGRVRRAADAGGQASRNGIAAWRDQGRPRPTERPQRDVAERAAATGRRGNADADPDPLRRAAAAPPMDSSRRRTATKPRHSPAHGGRKKPRTKAAKRPRPNATTAEVHNAAAPRPRRPRPSPKRLQAVADEDPSP